METASQPSLRLFAVVFALAAGGVHIGQAGVHVREGWLIAAFFLVVGVAQLTAAILLLRPRPRGWFWLGIAGSAGVIAIWAISRTVGLPLVEFGRVELVGVADSFASLAEAWTIVILGVYLATSRADRRLSPSIPGAVLVLGLAGMWMAAAAAGAFNADPARLAAAQPSLLDWLVATAGATLAAGLVLGTGTPVQVAWRRGLLRGLIGATGLAAAGLVWLTLPPTIGQNLDCRYAPLSTILAISHSDEPKAVNIGIGETRILPIFELRVCGVDRRVTLEGVKPVTVIGDGARIDGFWLLPAGTHLEPAGAEVLPSGAQAVQPGAAIEAGQPRQLVVRMVGTGGGDYTLGSVRLTYYTTQAGAFSFATTIAICSGVCPAD